MDHCADVHWTDGQTGHNVGQDELQATRFIDALPLAPNQEAPAEYAERVLRTLNEARARFRAIEPDPDGYGSGTFGEVIAGIETRCETLRIVLPTIAEPPLPDDDWYELERRLNDARAHIRRLVDQEEILLLLDQIQIAMFLTLIRMHRDRDRLSDADIAYYSSELYGLRATAMFAVSGVPKILLGYFYRFIVGIANAVRVLRGRMLPEVSPTDERLPYVCFALDFEAGRRAIDEQGIGSGVYRVTEDAPHGRILLGLSYADGISTPEERAFLTLLFRGPVDLLKHAGESVLYHYLEAGLVDADAEAGKRSCMFCLTVRRSEDGSLDVSGWNCGEVAGISADVHQLTLAAAFQAALGSGETDSEGDDMLAHLSCLLRPQAEHAPRPGEEILILAEGPASVVPFAALRLRDGRALASVAPITMILTANGETCRNAIAKDPASAIVISVRQVGGRTDLAVLPHATREGEAVARAWRCRHLQDDLATPTLVGQMLERHAMVHIATHGVVCGTLRHLDRALAATSPVSFLDEAERAMDAASLMLGGDTFGDPSVLSGRDLQRLDLTGTHLVFLSLCSGASARAVGHEAAFGIAQSLVRAGACFVVATLLPVDDAIAHGIAVRFHEFFISGMSPAAALQHTQLELARAGHGWHIWGGYQILASMRRPT